MRARQAIVLSTSVNIGIAAIGAITGILTARALGPEYRGYLAAVMAWFAISLVVSEFGQSAAVTFFVAKNSDRSGAYIATARKIMLVGGIVVGVLGFLSAELLAGANDEVAAAYRIAFAGSLINAVAAPFVYALQAISYGRWNTVRFSQPVFHVVFLLILYLSDILTIISAVCATIASFIGQLFVAYVLYRLSSQEYSQPSRADSSELMKYGVAQSASSIPATLTEQYDRVILSWSVGAYQLGQYAVALTVSQASRSLGTAIASVVFPMSAKLAGDEDSRVKIERRSYWVTAFASGAALLLIGWISQPLVPVLFGEQFSEAVPLIWLLIPVMWLRGLNALNGAFLRGRQRPFYATIGQLTSLVVGGTLLFIFAPNLGLLAAPIGFVVGEALALIANTTCLHIARKRQASTLLEDSLNPGYTRS